MATAKETGTETVRPKSFITKLNYYLPPELGGTDTYAIGSANDGVSNKWLPADVLMTDVRSVDSDFTLDKHGFQFVKHHTDYGENHDWNKPGETRKIYTNELEHFLKELTGATSVVTKHSVTRGMEANEGRPMYATMVHTDMSYNGAQVFATKWAPGMAERLEKCRWTLLSVWRPAVHTATRTPLAVCDARSVRDDELREVLGTPRNARSIVGPVGMWNVVKPDHPNQHKWYYLSEMTLDDVVLIKLFDSAIRGGIARRTPHTAFTTPFDYGETRKSVETRCLLLYEDQPLEGLGEVIEEKERGSEASR